MLLVRQFVEGKLENARQLSDSEFEQLEETVLLIHSRNIARLDIHSKNIALAERPYLFDFDMVTTPDDASFEADRERDTQVLEALRKRR
jgi:tRNA A-37 threonylcarbamoyl transferase component Bud32